MLGSPIVALKKPLLPAMYPSTDTMSAPAADSLTDHEGVRRIMKGIARSHGTAQKQAKPLTAEALAAVKATATTRRPLGDSKKQESAETAS